VFLLQDMSGMLKTGVIRILAMAAHYAAALGLLFRSYPWSVYSNFDFPLGMTLVSYLLVGAIGTSVAAGLSMMFGPSGANIPGTRVRGIFFAEWMFVVFFVNVGLPLSALASLLQLLLDRRIAKPPR
jgi:hypothetical protein